MVSGSSTSQRRIIVLRCENGSRTAEEASGISQNILHCNWSSPAAATVDGKTVIIFAAGDGFCYAFDPVAKEDEEGFLVFPELWKVDCNPESYRFDENGEPIKYATFDGPSECISTPVIDDGKVYIAIGQDPEHGEGVGRLSAIDVKTGAVVWTYDDLERSLSTASVAPNPDREGEKLVYIADYRGRLHCLDAKNGRKRWVHDTKSHIWGSTLVVDDKVYLGNEDGEITIMDAGQRMKGHWLVEFTSPIYAGPVAANGVLYICTQTHLYAFEVKK